MKLSLAFVLTGLAAFATAGPVALERRASVEASGTVRASASVSGSVPSASGVALPPAGPQLDLLILQYALTLEHLEANFYAQGLRKFNAAAFKSAGLSADVRADIVEIGAHEAAHVKALSGALASFGVTPTAKCTYDFGLTDVKDFLAKASLLEGVGVSAYLGAATDVSNKALLKAAGSILAVEARHASAIEEDIGGDGAPSAFETPLDYSQVFSLASNFIVRCPKTNPTLPVEKFPTLSVSDATAKARQQLTFSFDASADQDSTLFVHLLNGLSDQAIKLDSKNRARIPSGLDGRVYAVVSTSSTLTDANTVAGPVVIDIVS